MMREGNRRSSAIAKMKNICVKILISALFYTTSPYLFAETKFNSDELCKEIKKEKGAIAILLDANGKISKGPINFGRLGYTYSLKDFYSIPTNHFLAISPARLKLGTCHIGCLEFKAVANACQDVKIYAINYLVLDKESFNMNRSWLPWKENEKVEIDQIEDPESDFPPPIKYRFEARIVGEIYDATSKK
jgi:hypothetical protein